MFNEKFWDSYLRVYDRLNRIFPYKAMLDLVVSELEIRKGDRVLDAGCGTGNLLTRIDDAGAKVIGVDASSQALKIVKKKRPNLETYQQDLSKPFPFKNGEFDSIACSNTLYVLPTDARERAISEFNRVLKKGGTLVVTNQQAEKFSITGLLKYHINSYSGIKKVSGFFEFLYFFIPVLAFDIFIGLNLKKGVYSYIYHDDLVKLLEKNSFRITNIDKTYGNQNFLIKAFKE